MNFEATLNRKFASSAVLAAILLLASACGASSASDEAGIASLNGNTNVEDDGTSAGDAGLDAPENPEDAFALFDACMAEAGFAFGGGVSVGGSGGIAVEPGAIIEPDEVDPQQSGGSFEDFDPEAFDQANETCKGHLDNIDSGFDLTPEQQAALDDAQLEWSECMRDQGVDVPELATSSGSGGAIVIEGSARSADPQSGDASFEDLDFDFEGFEEASKVCQSVYDQYDELDGLFDQNQANQ